MRPVAALRALTALVLLAAAPALGAQDVPIEIAPSGLDPREQAQRGQERFENFRRANLMSYNGGGGTRCEERVGRFCYWYDEVSPPPPPDRPIVVAARLQFVRTLDSLARILPTDEFIAGQRVRYAMEAGLAEAALTAANECRAYGWWCGAFRGLALHNLGRFADAEIVWDSTLTKMSASQRCMWLDISLYLDDDTRRLYSRNACGSEPRVAFEQRTWWLARVRYGMRGNDLRSEHFSRLTYAEILRGSATPYAFGFDEDERELLLRFGWTRGWMRGPDVIGPGGQRQSNVIGHEPVPAYRFIPPFHVVTSPVTSDSTDWAVQLPPVVARYHPPYATRLLMLEHQQGLFRRGDTALVVIAYDVSKIERIGNSPIEAALIATPTGVPQQLETVQPSAPKRGTLTVRAPWGPLLMSAEIAVPAESVLVRARYGIRPPLATGTRVSLSDLLFYQPYGRFPTTIEEALPHAIPTQRINSGQKLGVFWESYGTNPNGEVITISLTVVPETEESSAMSRAARRLGLARGSAPVSLTVQDVSTRGSTTSARALELDVSTLRRGEYLVQLEVTVAGQYSIRTDRRIVVIGS
jgi:hypothetical protein